MTKIDFKTQDKAFYSGKPGIWARLTVPPLTYLMIDGTGDPDGADYANALAALYPLAYAIKFAAKAAGADFVVPPLDSLWWADDPAAFASGDRAAWHWRAMLRMPESTTQADLETARAKKCAASKSGGEAFDSVRLEVYDEGPCLQTLHIGPFSQEGPVLAELHEVIMPEAGLTFGKPHHEIYLSDFRRTAPEKLRTILRQPVLPQGPGG